MRKKYEGCFYPVLSRNKLLILQLLRGSIGRRLCRINSSRFDVGHVAKRISSLQKELAAAVEQGRFYEEEIWGLLLPRSVKEGCFCLINGWEQTKSSFMSPVFMSSYERCYFLTERALVCSPPPTPYRLIRPDQIFRKEIRSVLILSQTESQLMLGCKSTYPAPNREKSLSTNKMTSTYATIHHHHYSL